MNMNMKKMRGVIDPYTLGFILAALISAVAITTTGKQPDSETQIQKAADVQQVQPPVQKPTGPFAAQ